MLYLASFPRSGNTFVRYCIEYLTNKKTLGCIGGGVKDIPICQRDGIENLNVDENSRDLGRKVHEWWKISDKISNDDSLLLIVRNYKECLVRHHSGQNDVDGIINKYGENYLNLVEKFDNFEGNKFFVYYEDLINDNEFQRILFDIKNFLNCINGLNISNKKVEKFLNELDWHRKNSLSSYSGTSQTGGEKVKYHQKTLNQKEREKMDEYFWDKNSILSDKYLSKYKE